MSRKTNKLTNMDFSKMTTEQIERIISILQDLFDNKYGELSDENKKIILRELRDAKLEHILNR